MPSHEGEVVLRRLQERPEVRDWIEVHVAEVAAFEHYLREVAPGTWQEEFVRIVLLAVEHQERD